ncbi:sugar O-acetyltransferase [bacterium]|nr:sugar O-acetyltransferase [bacterium]
MLNQESYNAALDYPLYKERMYCKGLCHKFNQLSPEKIRERNTILTKILGKTGKVFLIEQPFMCDYGYNIEIGENFGANHNLLILDPAKVTFGDNVMVGPNCGFYTTKHPLEPNLRYKGLQWAEPIVVKNNVWICSNVTVLAGVTIGENSVIGAGSVVTKDIPPNSLAVGNPCKVIKQL